jgi:hypothetical protein
MPQYGIQSLGINCRSEEIGDITNEHAKKEENKN